MNYEKLYDDLDKHRKSNDATFDGEPVSAQNVADAEARLKLSFHPDLKKLWLAIGYGHIKRQHPLTNTGERIEDIFGFAFPPEIAVMVEDEPDRFVDGYPFFDISDGDWLIVRHDGKVAFDYDPEVVVADNVAEFIQKIFADARFLVNVDHDASRVQTP
jgi:cell wall assembly regulator SMI1